MFSECGGAVMSVVVTSSIRNLRLHSVTLFLASLCLPGCWLVGGSPTAPQPSLAPVRRLYAHSIQENSRYQEVVRAFSAGDRAGALRLLEALRLTPGLSAADLAFLDRQITLCQGKPPNPRPAGVGG